jgi:hypothetical protein
VKSNSLIAASALALVQLAAPAAAQHQDMPGMQMPGTHLPARANKAPARKPAAKKKAPAKKPAAKRKAAPKRRAPAKPAASIEHMNMPMESTGAKPSSQPMPMDHSQHGGLPMPPQPAPGADQAMPMDHSQHGGMPMKGMQGMSQGERGGHQMAMSGSLGSYPMEREASGTAWQPDTSEHMGLHVMSGDWMLMAHGLLNLVYDHQSGPRGDHKVFASGMLMGMARRPLGNGTLQLKAMVSPDPLMGKSGYPLLLASGETANGSDRLIDRQHPHDLFMELSASVSQKLSPTSSAFLYAGLPGEPAFGPPAFMHREAIADSPEAPISHHWLDSTHISFGVVTAGVVFDRAKLEVSWFNAREPDQHRWDIETGPLDSTAVRVSWNPTPTLALQGSWGHFEDPEQLEPGVDQTRWSATALYSDEIAPGWKLAATLAWGRKSAHGHDDDAYVAEAALRHSGWTVFGRGEVTENRELTEAEHGPAFRVGKASLGAVRDFRIADDLAFGAGGLVAVNFIPDGLAPSYGGHHPVGMVGFLRVKLD